MSIPPKVSLSTLGSKSPFNTPPKTPSGHDTTYFLRSILKKDDDVDKNIRNTWKNVRGTEPSVTFVASRKTVLIATREERQALVEAKDIRYSCWTKDDYKTFKQEAINELKDHMKKYGIDSLKEAMIDLYQPEKGS